MVWLVLTLMTAAAVLCATWPLLRPSRGTPLGTSDVDFYAGQLRALDAEVERGHLRPADLDATRAELGRRLLGAAAQSGGSVRVLTLRHRRIAAGLAGTAVVVLAAGLYAAVGRPTLADEPLAAREKGGESFAIALAREEAHLAADPNDGRGFSLMAPVYMRLGRFEDAAGAYAAAIRVLGPTPARLAELGQAQVMAADGVVTAEARKSFDDALKTDPAEPQAQFFEGLAALQDGDKAKARAIWTALADGAPPNAPFVAPVRARLAELDGSPSVSAGAPTPPVAVPEGGPAAAMPAGAAAIAALPPEQRSEAIRGMVDGLASRLAQNGNDPDAWLRLVRAYRVLGEPDLARKALADARRSVGGDPKVAGRLDQLAHELGLEG